MVENTILKQINFLSGLPEEKLEMIGGIAQLETFDEETILFRQNQEQTLIYMLVSGKVFLNSRSASGKSLTLDEVGPGRTFGVSALMGETSSTFTAVCAEKSQVVTISGDQMQGLFTRDFETGHLLMKKVVASFKRRMELHTRQFLGSLADHPQIRDN